MKEEEKILTPGNLIEISVQNLQAWHVAITAKDFDSARGISREMIAALKLVLKRGFWDGQIQANNQALTMAVLYKMLEDFLELSVTLENERWFDQNEVVESTWIKFQDCKDRFRYVQNIFKEGDPAVELIMKNLKALEEWFQRRFGPGLYASPDILVRKANCTICEEDIRACIHIPGHLYDGQICRRMPDSASSELRSVSVVLNPKDPRCRYWPWNATDGNKLSGIVLTTFSIDNFLQDETSYSLQVHTEIIDDELIAKFLRPS